MRLTTDENSLNYPCTVVSIGQVFDIPNADNIKRVVLFGNNVIVSNKVKEGDKMLYFVAGTQLSHDLCFNNNLYDEAQLNKNTDEKGYISAKRRLVKAIKLRGTISDGMLLPVEALDYLREEGIVASGYLKVGDTFTHFDGFEICQKYVVPAKQQGLPKGEKQPKQDKLKDVIVPNQFRLHGTTAHFARNLSNFDLESQIIISRKFHGSSLILSHVLVNKKLNWIERLIDKFIPQNKTQYGFVWSSGKPKSGLPKGVEAEEVAWKSHTPSFYSNDLWKKAYELHKDKLEKGISIYAEIVGNGVQDGDNYRYGYDYQILVYRITQTNPDGQVYELSWEEVKKYCEKYGLLYVTEFFSGKVKELVPAHVVEITQRPLEELLVEYLSSQYLDKDFPDCKIDEGICIRLRGTEQIFKLRSPKFLERESKQLEQGIENES